MDYIIDPAGENTQERVCGNLKVTLCWLCKENPAACPPIE